MSKEKITKGELLLTSSKTVSDRAEQYAERIAKTLNLEFIENPKEEIAKLQDKIFDLEDFSLDTDKNKGQERLTKEDCEERFRLLFQTKKRVKLLELELKIFQEIYNDYFS